MADKYEIEIIPQVTGAAIQGMAKLVGAAFGNVQNRLGSAAGGAAAGIAGAAGGAASAATAVAAGPLAAIGAISQVADVFAKFVNAANPAVMEMFTQAMNDAFAVVGQALIPVFQVLTPLMRMMGDYIASILPDQAQMNELMAAFQPLLDTFGSILGTLAPVVKMLNDLLLSGLISALEWVVKTIDLFIKALANMAYELLSIVDEWTDMVPDDFLRNLKTLAEGGKVGLKRSATGAAAGGAQFSSIGDLNKSAITGAFGSGAMNPQEKLVEVNKEQLLVLKDIAQKQGGLWGFFAGAPAMPQGG